MCPNKLLAVPGWASVIMHKANSPSPLLCLGTKDFEVVFPQGVTQPCIPELLLDCGGADRVIF